MISIRNIFHPIPLKKQVEHELEEAQRQLLKTEANEAYYRHMSAYHRERVEKLRAQLHAPFPAPL